MKKSLFFCSIFFIIPAFLFSQSILKFQENDQNAIRIQEAELNFLTNNDWHCSQLLIEKRQETGRFTPRIKFSFKKDHQLIQNKKTGTWKIERDSFLLLQVEDLDERRDNYLLRGYYSFVKLTDSTLILTKILTSSIDYRYTYFFENNSLVEKKQDARTAERNEQWMRFSQFRERYSHGVTILEDSPEIKKIAVVTIKNCGIYLKQVDKEGNTHYTKDGVAINKSDYENDIELASTFPKNKYKKPHEKADQFMRGTPNKKNW